MGVFRFLSALIPRSAMGCYVVLFVLLFGAGVLLTLLGFDLGEVDAWIDAHGGWFDTIGSLIFRAICAIVILICLFMIWSALFERESPDRPGIGCALLAAVVGFFATFGMIG